MPDSPKTLPNGETAASALSEAKQKADLNLPEGPRRGRNDPFPNLELLWIKASEIDDAPRRLRRAAKVQEEAIKGSVRRIPFEAGGAAS